MSKGHRLQIKRMERSENEAIIRMMELGQVKEQKLYERDDMRTEALLQEQNSVLSAECGVCVSHTQQCFQYCSRKTI